MYVNGYRLDLQTNNVQEHFAVVYAPRRQRNRFSENCVTLFKDETSALKDANKESNLRAAKVIGPCRSSESVNLYYLVDWLGKDGFQ